MSTSTPSLRQSLDDLLDELRFARGSGDLGRLALLAYCDVRRWARAAGEDDLALQSSALIRQSPHSSREAFVAEVDELIGGLAQARERLVGPD